MLAIAFSPAAQHVRPAVGIGDDAKHHALRFGRSGSRTLDTAPAASLRQPLHNNRSNKDDRRSAKNIDASTLVRGDATRRTALQRVQAPSAHLVRLSSEASQRPPGSLAGRPLG
jgi:hypothetical protein